MKKFLKKSNYKVVFFCPSIEEGGVEKNLINISNNLSNEIDISLISANENKRKYFNNKIKYIAPKNKFFNYKSRFLKVIVSIFLFFKFFFGKKTIIVSFQANIAAIVLGKIFRSKVIIRSNSSPNYYAKNFLKKKIMKFFYFFADKVIVNSDEFKKEFKKYFNIDPIRIYNLLENPKKLKKKSQKKIKFPFFDKNTKKCIKILAIGRLVKQKDHITILKALSLLKNKINFKFCLIGKGNLKEKLNHFVVKNKMNKYVKFVGYKDNVYPYYKKADLYILSSLYEGLPNTLIEANYFNLAIISSDCKTGPKEILESNKSAKFFKVGNYKELSNIILSIKIKKKKKYNIDKKFEFYNNLFHYKKLILSIAK